MPKKSKLSKKSTSLPGPFEPVAYKTERSAVGVLMHWMRQIIEEKGLDLGMPDVDTGGRDRKSPDIIICESQRSKNVLLVMEAKQPYFDVFSEELKEKTRKEATKRNAKYFAITNFNLLIWYKTEAVNELKREEEQLLGKYHLSSLEDLNDLEDSRFSSKIKTETAKFLSELWAVYKGKPEPRLAIDDLLISLLYEKIRILSANYSRIIDDLFYKNPSFASQVRKWFADQRWDFVLKKETFDQVAHQTAYLLINKILFYLLLQAKRPDKLDPLEIPEGLSKGAMLQHTLQGYFAEVLKIDYETVYTTDFIDSIAFPDSKEIVKEIKELVRILKRYDFSKLGYDIIGRIFEQLIPPEERHNLGQYFTSPDVVDLILRFCLHHEDDKILDPACGAGTFLVRAYQHKKMMNQRKTHEELLDGLWGNDIAKFPAHLATINLAINDLSVESNYPNILQKDFFEFQVGPKGMDLENWRKARSQTLGFQNREVVYPRWLDAIVGNPPYTRHHQIGEISPHEAEYKAKLIQNAVLDLAGKPMAEIDKRAGIHVYFFVHATKFLKDNGYFGFIVSNSWLDADYGKGLQDFIIKNYKIIAIIESKVERWFEAAEVNTCIIILQKCRDEKERQNHLVRFVYLKKPIQHFIPAAQDLWEKQLQRLQAIDQLIKTLLAHDRFYENDELRIFPKRQNELREEGLERDEGYLGSKWGKYIRAPQIFFTVTENIKKKLIPLRKLAEVNEGKPTGANDFFYVTKEIAQKYKIERRFLKPGLMKPRGNTYYELRSEHIGRYFFTADEDKENLKGTGALAYIKHGEHLKLPSRNTYRNKPDWYKFGSRKPAALLIPCGIGDCYYCSLNRAKAISSNSFTEIRLYNLQHAEIIWAFLNSTLGWLFIEVEGRSGMGGGMLKVDPTDIRKMLVIDPQYQKKSIFPRLKEMLIRPVGGVEEELEASDHAILDDYIMGDILGLSKEEQGEVKEALKELVTIRLEKAKSFSKIKKPKGGLQSEQMIEVLANEVDEES